MWPACEQGPPRASCWDVPSLSPQGKGVAHQLPCPAVWTEGENDHKKQNFWQFLKVLFKSKPIFFCVSVRTDTPGWKGSLAFPSCGSEVRSLACGEGWGRTTMSLGWTTEAGSEVQKRGCLEERDWGRSEPACHLRESPNKPSEVGLVLKPRLGR